MGIQAVSLLDRAAPVLAAPRESASLSVGLLPSAARAPAETGKGRDAGSAPKQAVGESAAPVRNDPRGADHLLAGLRGKEEGGEGGASASASRDERTRIKRDSEKKIGELEGELSRDERKATERGQARTAEERSVVSKLQARDLEVRAHEAAHVAAGGSYVKGAATFSYQRGPDGKSYAVGGEVQIDTSPVPGNPEATIAKMSIIKAAALAPAEPSGADIAAAAAASQQIVAASAQMAGRRAEELADKYVQGGALPEAGRVDIAA
jgi:hypothetical protein